MGGAVSVEEATAENKDKLLGSLKAKAIEILAEYVSRKERALLQSGCAVGHVLYVRSPTLTCDFVGLTHRLVVWAPGARDGANNWGFGGYLGREVIVLGVYRRLAGGGEGGGS